MKKLAVLASAMLAVAVLAAPSPAQGSTGSITRAYANPTWTTGSIAGSVTWDECQVGRSCYWFAIATVQPALPVYDCNGEEWFEYEDPNITQVWGGSHQTANGTVSFDLPSTPILHGVQGQRLCLSVVYKFWRQHPVCIVQAPILGGDPADCPWEQVIVSKEIAGKLFGPEPPPAPPAAVPLAPPAQPKTTAKPKAKKTCPKGKKKVQRQGKTVCVKKAKGKGKKG